VKRNTKIALILVIVSCAFWAGLLVVPFLNVSGTASAWICGGLIVAGELTFWGGALLVGRDLMLKHRDKLWPPNWFRRRPEKNDETDTEKVETEAKLHPSMSDETPPLPSQSSADLLSNGSE
jgi:hypothetical protein